MDIPRNEPEFIRATFEMAALTYIHCPKFLDELVDCVSEFRDYVTKVASSIKTAATEVAMGIVGVKGEKDGTPSEAFPGSYSIRREQSLGDITHTILLEDSSWAHQTNSAVDLNKCSIYIEARIESPILVIPRNPNSPQVGDFCFKDVFLCAEYFWASLSEFLSFEEGVQTLRVLKMEM